MLNRKNIVILSSVLVAKIKSKCTTSTSFKGRIIIRTKADDIAKIVNSRAKENQA